MTDLDIDLDNNSTIYGNDAVILLNSLKILIALRLDQDVTFGMR